MRLLKLLSLLVAAIAIADVSHVAAMPPDRLDHFHVVPRLSTLTETGGFAGIEREYDLRGEYDFVREWIGGTPTEGLRHQARFDNVDLRAPLGELLPAFIDVGQLLNLEGLTGELLPLGAPFDVYRFRGHINDSLAASPLENSHIELYTALIGRWMYVWGETTPPPGSADFFEYELRVVARQRPWADFDGDGVVSGVDYAMWREGHGAGSGATLTDWQTQYGESAPDMPSIDQMFALTAAFEATPTPEPAATMLAMLLVSAAAISRRR